MTHVKSFFYLFIPMLSAILKRPPETNTSTVHVPKFIEQSMFATHNEYIILERDASDDDSETAHEARTSWFQYTSLYVCVYKKIYLFDKLNYSMNYDIMNNGPPDIITKRYTQVFSKCEAHAPTCIHVHNSDVHGLVSLVAWQNVYDANV